MSDKKSFSRRAFLKISALVAGSAVAAKGLSLPSTAFAQGTQEITFAIPGRERETKFANEVINAFNAKMQADNKPFRAKLNPGPATDTDFKTKISLDAASGTLADVVWVNNELYQDFAAAGYLADLTPKLDAYKDWDKFAPVIKKQLAVNDKVFAMSSATTFTMFYRKDLLQEAGIAVTQPNTWEDFYKICEQIATKTKAIPAGIPAARAWGGGSWGEGFRHIWLGYAKPEEIFDPADGKWVVKSSGLLKALQVYETLAKNKWLTVESLLSPKPWEPIKYQGFPQKTVAVVTGGDWQWEFDWGPNGATPIEGLFEKVDRWLFPAEVSQPFVTTALGRILVIYSKSPNIDAAFEFVTWFFSPEGSCKAFEVYMGGVSARSDMAEKCAYYNTGIGGKIAAAAKNLEAGRFLVVGTGQSKIADGIAATTEDVITLQQTPEQAMDAFAKKMKDAFVDNAVKEL